MTICRVYLTQKFSVAICRGFLVFVSKSFFVYVSKSCLYESQPFSYVTKTFLFVRFSLLTVFFLLLRWQLWGVRWLIIATTIAKRNIVKKENFTNKKVLLNYEKCLLPYKQDSLTYTKKDSLTNTINPRQIAMENSCGNFPRKTPMANSYGKFSRQIATANSCGKFSWQISATISRGK